MSGKLNGNFLCLIYIIILLQITSSFSGCIDETDNKDTGPDLWEYFYEFSLSITLISESDTFLYVPMPIFFDVNKTMHPSQLSLNITEKYNCVDLINCIYGLSFNISTTGKDLKLSHIIHWKKGEIPVMNTSAVVNDLSMNTDPSTFGSYYVYSNSHEKIWISYYYRNYSTINGEEWVPSDGDGRSHWECDQIELHKGWQICEI